MCSLTGKHTGDSQKCYKVAAKCLKTGKYYSIATGIEYKSGEKVEIPDHQQRISDYFASDLLEPNYRDIRSKEEIENLAYAPNLVGKTAAFKKLNHAITLAIRMNNINKHFWKDNEDFCVVVFECRFLGLFLSGTYSISEVCAGEVMEIGTELGKVVFVVNKSGYPDSFIAVFDNN